uniref:Uncharacterized protein n=1 Tax=Ananas comosus var. bracteatus TaxID=296719 RepID=A0A6V7QST6_ANACO
MHAADQAQGIVCAYGRETSDMMTKAVGRGTAPHSVNQPIISTRRPSSSHAREAFARASRPSNAQGLGKAVAVVVVVVVWAPHPYGEARARSRGARGWAGAGFSGEVVATRAAAAAAAVTASPAAVPSTLSFDSFPPGPLSFTRC